MRRCSTDGANQKPDKDIKQIFKNWAQVRQAVLCCTVGLETDSGRAGRRIPG